MVTFPARVTKVGSFTRAGSPSGKQVAGMFGLIGYLAYQGSLQSPWYTLAIPDHDEIGIESSGSFTVGQCVLLRVRKANAEAKILSAGVARLEPYENCVP